MGFEGLGLGGLGFGASGLCNFGVSRVSGFVQAEGTVRTFEGFGSQWPKGVTRFKGAYGLQGCRASRGFGLGFRTSHFRFCLKCLQV